MKTAPSADAAVPSAIVAATAAAPDDDGAFALDKARAFAQPLLAGRNLDSGEEAYAHACGVAEVLRGIGAAPGLQAAAYLVYAGDFLQKPGETVARAFGESYADLVELTRKLVAVQRAARDAPVGGSGRVLQTERVRKMLLAFSRDLRVVLLRLASRLQTLRWHAASRTPCPQALALETQQVFAPLASRLGIWQVKWELEDLAFRFLLPEDYRRIARLLDETRSARELDLAFVRHQLGGVLRQAGLEAEVQGRPKHLYSIWKKMQGKQLAFERVFDLRALRVIVDDVPACYAALSAVHSRYRALPEEYDDYIARPKANGYQSLHTVVQADDGRTLEVQIRTRAMHEHAEHGVAAHWAYKEAGARGYAGASVASQAAERVAEARRAVMRQLLAWERELSSALPDGVSPMPATPAPSRGGLNPSDPLTDGPSAADERIYVLTPQSTVVELGAGATPVDFAYAVHTELGHRCRGARVDGALVPLNTALANGQTVDIVSVREGGPSLDWLNPELGYLRSPRARAKVRAWFNALAQRQTIARGRELVEKLLQREGRTAVKLDELAARLGLRDADNLFEAVGKDELPLRQIENLLRPPAEVAPEEADAIALRRSRAGDSGVRVVGVDALMTSLARCCRPAPPDAIGGFVTRGKGVVVHRVDCADYRHIAERHPERVLAVDWGRAAAPAAGAVRPGPGTAHTLYPVDLHVEAGDRQGLLRDISEVFARERFNVTGVQTRSVRDAGGGTAFMSFTVEVDDARRLGPVLRQVAQVPGVRSARRR